MPVNPAQALPYTHNPAAEASTSREPDDIAEQDADDLALLT